MLPQSLLRDPHEMNIIVAYDNFDVVMTAIGADAPLTSGVIRSVRDSDDANPQLEYNGQKHKLVSKFFVGQSCHPLLVVLQFSRTALGIDRGKGWKQSCLYTRAWNERAAALRHYLTILAEPGY